MRSMNKLPMATRVQILSMLVEGSSLRSISRITGTSINTVSKLLVDAGMVCAGFHDAKVRNVAAERVECDEVWSFCYAKAKNVKRAKAAPDGAGDVWTWTGIESKSKLLISWWVGDRSADTGELFMRDLASRLANRIQLTTDGHGAYIHSVRQAFGGEVDYAQLIKIYKETSESVRGRYSPSECIGAKAHVVSGKPDLDKVSTSYAERQNLNMRMSMRRFTRLTSGHSKKFMNHVHMVALYTTWYNWIRQHKAHKLSPAMAAGLTDKLMSMADIVALMDAREEQALANKRRAMLNQTPEALDKFSY